MKNQTGVGLVEVLVALVLLAIAVLGFTALQVRALSASHEANQNIQAMNIARDVTERMRINRTGLGSFDTAGASAVAVNCSTTLCSNAEMAAYDFSDVHSRAEAQGMDIAVLDCQGGSASFKRKCVYVAWDKTTPTDGSAATDCTNGTAYHANAQCIIMETYNYD